MGIIKSTGKVAGHIVNVRVDQWFDLEGRKQSLSKTLAYTKTLFHTQEANHEETFEEAVKRLNLTEDDLKKSEKAFHRNMILFSITSLMIFGYSIYLATLGTIGGFFVGLAMTIYTMSLVFRYHFWLYQLQHKKLGCSFHEWLHSKKQG